MMSKKIVVTGCVAFVGSNFCLGLKKTYPGDEAITFDNIKRRGPERVGRLCVQLGCNMNYMKKDFFNCRIILYLLAMKEITY
jgi:nucleoside-diphosphate-sugar epimerase